MGAEDIEGFVQWREKLPGLDVWSDWEDCFVTKYTHMTRAEIRALDTPFLRHALRTYKMFKATGHLPNGVTQSQEKPVVLEVITLFNDWMDRMPEWQRENKDFL